MKRLLVTTAPVSDAFTRVEHSGAQRRDGDDELSQVAERSVEEPADRVSGLRRDALRGAAEERGERKDGGD
jgi:hypothetical protein